MSLSLAAEVAEQLDPTMGFTKKSEPEDRRVMALGLQLKELIHALYGIEEELRMAREDEPSGK